MVPNLSNIKDEMNFGVLTKPPVYNRHIKKNIFNIVEIRDIIILYNQFLQCE